MSEQAQAAPAAPTGGAPAAAPSGVSSGSPATTGSSTPSTTATKKIPYGMGPSEKTQQPVAQATSQELYNDDWWKTHGEGVFKHERFKELSGYKKQFEEVKPNLEFVQQNFGGFDTLQHFNQLFGPVYRRMSEMGPDANKVWGKLYPVFMSILNGEDIQNFGQAPQAASDPTDVDPFEERLAPVQKELNEVRETLRQKDEREKQERFQQIEYHRRGTMSQYENRFAEKLNELKDPSDPNDSVPEEVADVARQLIYQHLPQQMPVVDRNGNKLHALDKYSPEIFDKVWNDFVLARFKTMEGHFKKKFIKTSSNGGPVVPDTRLNGRTAGTDGSMSRTQRMNRFAEGLKRLGS